MLSKFSFKDQAFKFRENAILDAATAILGNKGYDLMTMDDVAGAVGISKPSLYKHFSSKEDLVGEALIRLLEGATRYLVSLPEDLSPLQKLEKLLEWALRIRLDGGVPFLPSTNNHVRTMLMRNLKYVAKIVKLNNKLNAIILKAQKQGLLNPDLPSDVILFSYYARTCDPTVDYLIQFSKISADEIIKSMLRVAFNGLR